MRPEEYQTLRALEDRHCWYSVLRGLVMEILERHLPRDGRVLDAGCGTGGMLQLLRNRWLAEGVDSSPAAVEHTLARGLPGRLGNVSQLDFPDATFDAVVCLDVLYHADVEQDQALAEFHRVLRPGGILLLNVPAFHCLRGSHDRAVCGARRYSASQVRRLLECHNFDVVMLHYWNAWLFLPILLHRWFSRLRKDSTQSDLSLPPPWLNDLLAKVGALEARICRRLRIPLGTSVFGFATSGSARKKAVDHATMSVCVPASPPP